MKFPIVASFFFLTITLLESCLSRKLIGGKQPVQNVNSDKMRSAIESAVYTYNQQANDKHWYTDVKVTDAQTQVVSGKQFHFKLHLKPTKCEKKDTLALTKSGNKVHCVADPNVEGVICDAKVLYQPWRKVQYKATLYKCHSDKTSKKTGKDSHKHDGHKLLGKKNNNKGGEKH